MSIKTKPIARKEAFLIIISGFSFCTSCHQVEFVVKWRNFELLELELEEDIAE